MKRVILMVALPLLFDAAVGCALALDARPGVTKPPHAQAHAATVFFYWDDSSLSPHARDVLAGVAHAQPSHAPARIMADSAADNLQGATYTALLGQRRMNSIVAELQRDGVPAERITAQAGMREVIVDAPVQLAGK